MRHDDPGYALLQPASDLLATRQRPTLLTRIVVYTFSKQQLCLRPWLAGCTSAGQSGSPDMCRITMPHQK
jgi:hypothetical protein